MCRLFALFLFLLFSGCDTTVNNDVPHLDDLVFEEVFIEQEAPPNINNGSTYGRVTLNSLEAVGGPTGVATRINDVIVNKLVQRSTYEAFIADYLPDENFIPRIVGKFYRGTVTLISHNADYITLKISTSDSNLCGASCAGTRKIRYVNFNTYGKILELSDVLSDVDTFYARAKAVVAENEDYWGVRARAFYLPPDWYIKQSGEEWSIVLQFQPYEVGPGVLGTVALSFPMATFEDLRVPQYWVDSYTSPQLTDIE